MYNDQFSKVETLFKDLFDKLNIMEKRQIKMAKQLEEMYYETEPTSNVEQVTEPYDDPDEETIKRLGQRIAYNLMDNPQDVARFRDFIYEAKTHPRQFTDLELKYIDIADKNFDDIRLSRKHLGILQSAYPKAYPGRVWPFKVKQGYMYKYGNAMHWEWFG